MVTTEIVAIAGVIATNVITIITLYMHLDNKTDKTLTAIQTEIRDFHGRLIKQDAEFKAGLQKQDAEFKAGMLLIEERLKK